MRHVEVTNVSFCHECLRYFDPSEVVIYVPKFDMVVCAQCSNQTNQLRQQPVRLKVYTPQDE